MLDKEKSHLNPKKMEMENKKERYLIFFRNAFEPYKEMLYWVNSFTINFLKKDASSSLLSSLPVESFFALLDNLAPPKIERTIQEKAGPFLFRGNDIGILLVHGFSSTAQEMKELGEYLNKKGKFTTFGILLSGHGTSPADLAQTDIIDWYESLFEGYKLLKHICKKVILLGHSMGATLSLILAANEEVDGIVTLCAPIKVEYFMQDYLFLISDLLKYFPRRKEEIEVMEKHNLLNYRVSALKAVENLLDLMEIAREEIAKVTAPLFTITAGKDERVPLYNAEKIHELVKSTVKQDYFAANSPHTILFGPEKELVIDLILSFIKSIIL